MTWLTTGARAGLVLWLATAAGALGAAHPAAAGQAVDPVASARRTAGEGRRAEALAALEAHLAAQPRDVDARLLYGLILSWEGRYEAARRELQHVLGQAPGYVDAQVALMNVFWWSGEVTDARASADRILSEHPGHQRAREVRDQLEAADRPWSAGVSYGNDTFNDNRDPWHEVALSITRLTRRGSLILRASEARRFGLSDQQVEFEFYPRLRPGTYAYVSTGVAPQSTLYPRYRVAFDLYQAVGAGFEISGGVRRLGFDRETNIYVATVGKYVNQWLLTGKVFHVPGTGNQDSTSYHGGFRRYVRGDGVSYVGLAYSHGFSREEIRNVADLATTDSRTLRVEIHQAFSRRIRVSATGGTSRQSRQTSGPLWQTSINTGFVVLF